MRRFISLLSLLLAACFVSQVSIANTVPPLADRHESKGLNCATCHGQEKPDAFAEVNETVCLQCHGPREELEKQYESQGTKNPHKNHLGPIECALCHKGHEKSSVYCAQCHKDFILPIK